jgi:hypothetical protein
VDDRFAGLNGELIHAEIRIGDGDDHRRRRGRAGQLLEPHITRHYCRELRRGIRQRGMGYVLTVRANHALTAGSGRTVTAAGAVHMIPAAAWHRMRTGSGTKGTRHYDWAMLEVTSDDTPDGDAGGHSVLLTRRHPYTGTLSFYRCWTPEPVPPSRLIAIAVTRWRIEDGHRWHRSSPVLFS